jgi:hypothetical protein
MRSMARIALALVVAAAVATTACDEGADKPSGPAGSPEAAQRAAMCRQLIEHILQITPRPGSDRPETDPARIKELAARIPIEDIEQCEAVKDAKVLACMQAATDAAALRKCIPAQAE